MTKFTDNLWRDLVREHGPTLARIDRPEPARSRRRRPRPRVLAGSSLGLAGVGAALVLVLGGSTAQPAFAVTKQGDGSVLVNLNYQTDQDLPQVNAKLAALGTGEDIIIYMRRGAASHAGPVTCVPAAGAARPTGPQVKVLVGTDGTETIAPGQSVGNTAEGTFHLDHCIVRSDTSLGNSGAG